MTTSERRRAEHTRGFVLPTSLLVVTLLTVMLTAAFVLVSAESRTTDNSLSSTRALSIAEAGLQTYLSQNRGLSSTSTWDSMRLDFSGGYAAVVARRMRPASTGQLSEWAISSTGYASDPLLPGTPQSKRAVGQVAQLNPGALPMRAALVALNGLVVTGGISGQTANPVSGVNGGSISGCVLPGGAANDSVGLSTYSPVPGPSYSQSPGPPPGGETGYGGVAGSGMEVFATRNTLYDSTHIDWPLLADSNGPFRPDYQMPGATLPAPGDTAYLVGRVFGDLTIPPSPSPWTTKGRHGVLVVTGDVIMANQAHWDGVMVIGGRLIAQGDFFIHGAVITGLNIMLGMTVVPDSIIRQNDSWQSGFSPLHAIDWSWCHVRWSTNALSGMAPVRNSWLDTWALY